MLGRRGARASLIEREEGRFGVTMRSLRLDRVVYSLITTMSTNKMRKSIRTQIGKTRITTSTSPRTLPLPSPPLRALILLTLSIYTLSIPTLTIPTTPSTPTKRSKSTRPSPPAQRPSDRSIGIIQYRFCLRRRILRRERGQDDLLLPRRRGNDLLLSRMDRPLRLVPPPQSSITLHRDSPFLPGSNRRIQRWRWRTNSSSRNSSRRRRERTRSIVPARLDRNSNLRRRNDGKDRSCRRIQLSCLASSTRWRRMRKRKRVGQSLRSC